MSFLRYLTEMEAKSGDVFMDGEGNEWTFISDGTASAIQCVTKGGKAKLKLTQEQLEITCAPPGFQKKLSKKEMVEASFSRLHSLIEDEKKKLETILED